MCAIERRYQDEGYRNWLSCINGLRVLRCRLRTFLEDQTQQFHQTLVNVVGTDTCSSQCDTSGSTKPKELPDVCEVCSKWSRQLLDNHKAPGSSIQWSNCNPQRWPTDKWEAAKVYMPGGHKTHIKFDDFDIAALVNLMSRCTHFHRVIKANKLQQVLDSVTEVRNQVMHSPDFTVSARDLKKHLGKIRDLGRVLKPYAPEMESLPEEINKGMGEQSLEKFKEMEQLAIVEEISFISMSFTDMSRSQEQSQELVLLVDSLWSFVGQHHDLQEVLSVQMAHLLSLRDYMEQLMESLAQFLENQRQLLACQEVAISQQQQLQEKQEELKRANDSAMRHARMSRNLARVAMGLGLLSFFFCILLI